MDKARVVHIRDMFKNLKFSLWNRETGEEKQFTPSIQIVCDNSLNVIDDNKGSVIWDDDNDIFYWFKGNTQGSTSFQVGLSMGVAVEFPYLCIAVDYDEIQNIRIPMNQTCFDQLCESLGSNISQEEKEYIEDMIVSEADFRNIKVRKDSTNYNTALPKKYDNIDGKDKSDPAYVYSKTIHKM
jgi:hypothetical protein